VPGRPIGHGPTRATPAATRARARWFVPSLLGAALAASLLVIVSQRAALRTTETRLAQRDSALAALATTLAARETTLATLLDAEREVLVVRLTSGADAAPGVQFFWNVRARRGVLRAYGLAPAPAGKAYQLWLIERGTPVPMPVFNTDAQGRAVLAGLEMPASTDGAEAIAITLEPDGGSRTPSSRPVLIGSLARGE
jgi:anti-sigma-K factor RskA